MCGYTATGMGPPAICGTMYSCRKCSMDYCSRCYTRHDHAHVLQCRQRAKHSATEAEVQLWVVKRVICRKGSDLLVRWEGPGWKDSLIPIEGNEFLLAELDLGMGPEEDTDEDDDDDDA